MHKKILFITLASVFAMFIGCDDSSSESKTLPVHKTVTDDDNDPSETPDDEGDDEDNTGKNGNTDKKNPQNDDGNKTDSCGNVDLMTDDNNCGSCRNQCGRYETCIEGTCTCNEGYFDCDSDGICETEGECECTEGQTTECYLGTDETNGVGACHGGTMNCIVVPGYGSTWDYANCEGQVLPSHEYVCDSQQPDLDLDCDGRPDATQDDDGDDYTICNEAGDAILDCCDNVQSCKTTRPDLIHPNQEDCFGNGIDDNCSGTPDDNPDFLCGQASGGDENACKIKNRTCSNLTTWKYNEKSNISATGALALAQAFDACLDIVTEASMKPGLIEFSISPASDYNIGIDPRQFNIKDGMYDVLGNKLIEPRVGGSFVILSSGIAGDSQTELQAHGVDDVKMSLGGSIPEPYRTAHHNQLQTHPLCASGGADIYDTVRLHLKMRAPETAKGISFDFRFFSREYPYYVCSKYNDFFLALLTDENGQPIVTDTSDTPDGNISFDRAGNPISVNNAFFTTCAASPCSGVFEKAMSDKCPAMMSCDASTQTCGGDLCTDGMTELAAYYPEFYSGTGDDPKVKRGGGTAWLTTKAPVNPGEIFNLDFYIWDTGDLRFDSSVILDNFQWSCEATTNATDFASPVEDIN